MLEGGKVQILDDEHRQKLLSECRFYRFSGLEQRLIEHRILSNRCRGTEEIVLNLCDVKPCQVSLRPTRCGFETVHYERPYIEKGAARELVIQIKDNEQIALVKSPPARWEASFYDDARKQVRFLLHELVTRLGCKREQVGPIGYVVDVSDSCIVLNGKRISPLSTCSNSGGSSNGSIKSEESFEEACPTKTTTPPDEQGATPRKRRLVTLGPDSPLEMVCDRSLWRIITTGGKQLVLQLLRAECRCGQRYTNSTREYL